MNIVFENNNFKNPEDLGKGRQVVHCSNIFIVDSFFKYIARQYHKKLCSKDTLKG